MSKVERERERKNTHNNDSQFKPQVKKKQQPESNKIDWSLWLHWNAVCMCRLVQCLISSKMKYLKNLSQFHCWIVVNLTGDSIFFFEFTLFSSLYLRIEKKKPNNTQIDRFDHIYTNTLHKVTWTLAFVIWNESSDWLFYLNNFFVWNFCSA